MPLGWKGYIYLYNPDNEALYHVSYPLFTASIIITAVRCQVKNTTWGGWGEGGREGKAYHHSTLIAFTFPLPLSLPPPPSPSLPPKITFKETKVNTEPYGSILIQQAIILNVFLVVRDPQCIDPLKSGKNIFSYILKFTWQPGGQSDIV